MVVCIAVGWEMVIPLGSHGDGSRGKMRIVNVQGFNYLGLCGVCWKMPIEDVQSEYLRITVGWYV